MIELATKLWRFVRPVGRMTSPALAAILGFLLGGISLAIYFRTVADFLVPVAIAIACLLLFEKRVAWLAPGYNDRVCLWRLSFR
jgi:hypothetical protein